MGEPRKLETYPILLQRLLTPGVGMGMGGMGQNFARSLCFFLGKTSPSFQQTPTKSWQGSWRKFLVLPDPRFSPRKRPFCTTCILDKIENKWK